ncbi:hypothetical protein P9112_004918 [Eukaryota sp. TZLM1-RC]
MTAGNNVVSNVHYLKKHKELAKMWFNQPAKKKARRQARAAKAARMFPRPTESLRPIVHCATQRYNVRQRLGRGFTMQELAEAGLSAKYARTIGIAVDHRRVNRCQESLQQNAQRLKEYVSKLTVFPMKKASNIHEAQQHVGTVMPLQADREFVTLGSLPTQTESCYKTLRNKQTEGRKKE